MNKNNQTTYIKCQYKIPTYNPKWWLYANTRHKPTAKKAVLIITKYLIYLFKYNKKKILCPLVFFYI